MKKIVLLPVLMLSGMLMVSCGKAEKEEFVGPEIISKVDMYIPPTDNEEITGEEGEENTIPVVTWERKEEEETFICQVSYTYNILEEAAGEDEDTITTDKGIYKADLVNSIYTIGSETLLYEDDVLENAEGSRYRIAGTFEKQSESWESDDTCVISGNIAIKREDFVPEEKKNENSDKTIEENDGEAEDDIDVNTEEVEEAEETNN